MNQPYFLRAFVQTGVRRIGVPGKDAGCVACFAREHPRTPPGAPRLGLGVPAAAFLLYLCFLLESGQHAVEVVLLDAHLGGKLGDADAGLALHERQRLGGACAGAFATSGATACGASCFACCFGGSGFCRCGAVGRAARTSGSTAAGGVCRGCGDGRAAGGRSGCAYTCERRGCGLEAAVLVHERLQLFQASRDLLALLVKKVGHDVESSSLDLMWSHLLRLDLTLILFVYRLEVCTQSFKCAIGLTLGHAADERAAHYRANRPQWGTKFVAVVKTCSVALCLQRIFAVRFGASRSATLPDCEPAGLAVDQLPVNVEAHSAHVDLLIHPVALAWRTVVGAD